MKQPSLIGLQIHALCYVVANLIQALVWWLFTPDLHFWPIWSILGWGAGLLAHYWSVHIARARRRAAS
ncbi:MULTISPECIES: 2TM domain-containing protein [Actinoplanes]|uniref:2TM domain-containing protein n=1 Tax=Actinoplanes TaxID=1865 RepID=UPI0005F279BE|nr:MULTISPECIES: 2TM domain-containing protein [Actinoplanes]GLY08115.1 hypothetical protein Acsp01_84940 [Actinoplanes sp. NBRC 101535]